MRDVRQRCLLRAVFSGRDYNKDIVNLNRNFFEQVQMGEFNCGSSIIAVARNPPTASNKSDQGPSPFKSQPPNSPPM
jgi:hypothetical protein